MIQGNYSTLQQVLQQPSSTIPTQSYAFMFVNSRSGSCIGDSLITSHIKQIKVNNKPNKNTTFAIFDLFDQKDRINAFKGVHQKCKTVDIIYIIICGGDGTVQWVIQESLKAQIDFQTVIFSVLPIGTGNDFAKSVGWGSFNFSIDHDKFQKLALQLEKAQVGYYDIWESAIECFDSGSVIQIKNGQQSQRKEKTLVKNFTNYFGIGTDAQIAYIAQRLKAKTAALKRVAYGFAGFLSFWMFCGGLRRIISQIQSIKYEQPTQQTQQLQMTQDDIKSKRSKKSLMENIIISKYDCCMTFINSTSSMDLEGIWKTPHNASSQSKKKIFKEQAVNDGLIEIVSYRNQISLWLERAFHMAKKVGQGNGPYIINFREPKQGKFHQIYIQINGQPYRITNARSITVSQSSQFPQGKIKVLYRQK